MKMQSFKNNAKTFILLAALGGLLMGIGSFFGQAGLIIGLGIGLVLVGASYWFSDKIAVKAAGAQPVTEQEAPQLYAMVRDLTEQSGMPMPKLYVCLLYTSDAADDLLCVDLGGRRII